MGDRAATVIRDVRSRFGLTQKALAARAGIAPARISEYETGKRDPGLDTLERIVRAAGMVLSVELHGETVEAARSRQILDLAAKAAAKSMAIEGKAVADDRVVQMGDGASLLRRIHAHSR